MIVWRSGIRTETEYRDYREFRRRMPPIAYHWEDLDSPGVEYWGWCPYAEYTGILAGMRRCLDRLR